MQPLSIRMLVCGLAGVFLTLASFAEASDALPKRPKGPVLDEAEIIPDDQETWLDKKLRDFWNDTGSALVVVSVKSLNNRKIEEFSLNLAREWDIGDPQTLRGLLVLVTPNEREVRIEVSCGLEGVISDKAALAIIQNDMLPYYRQDALSEGTLAGVDALIERINATSFPYPVSDECRELMRKAA